MKTQFRKFWYTGTTYCIKYFLFLKVKNVTQTLLQGFLVLTIFISGDIKQTEVWTALWESAKRPWKRKRSLGESWKRARSSSLLWERTRSSDESCERIGSSDKSREKTRSSLSNERRKEVMGEDKKLRLLIGEDKKLWLRYGRGQEAQVSSLGRGQEAQLSQEAQVSHAREISSGESWRGHEARVSHERKQEAQMSHGRGEGAQVNHMRRQDGCHRREHKAPVSHSRGQEEGGATGEDKKLRWVVERTRRSVEKDPDRGQEDQQRLWEMRRGSAGVNKPCR